VVMAEENGNWNDLMEMGLGTAKVIPAHL